MPITGGSATAETQYTKKWGEESSTQTSFNALSQDILNKFTEMAFANYASNQKQAIEGYSKSAAMADTQGLISSFMRQLTEQQLPSLVSQEAAGGAYGATATAALKNDAVARTAEASARAQLEGIAQYANIQSALQSTGLQDLYQALSLQKGGTVQADRTYKEQNWGASATGTANWGFT